MDDFVKLLGFGAAAYVAYALLSQGNTAPSVHPIDALHAPLTTGAPGQFSLSPSNPPASLYTDATASLNPGGLSTSFTRSPIAGHDPTFISPDSYPSDARLM